MISKDGKGIAHFHGRQLKGQQVGIPDGYKGLIVSSADSPGASTGESGLQAHADADSEENNDEDAIEENVLEEKANFENIMVWAHETAPEAATDPYLRGIEEWIGFAGAVGSMKLLP